VKDNQQPRDVVADDEVQCLICDRIFKTMVPPRHLSCTHKCTTAEYRERFHGAALRSNSYKLRQSVRFSGMNKEDWKDPAYREVQSERSSKKLSETLNRQWKDKKYRATMSKRSSDRMKARHQDPVFAAKSRERTAAGTTRWLKAQWKKPEYRKKMIQMSKDQWQGDNFERRYKIMINSWGSAVHWYTSDHGKYRLRSSWELMFAVFLDLLDIKWTYEEHKFLKKDGRHRYIPDFYLVDYDKFVEIKGVVFDDYKSMLKYVRRKWKVSILLFAANELMKLDLFTLIVPDKKYKLVRSRFNDHPVMGSRVKRLEVRKRLEALLGV
jgi:hypothetical protein